MPITTTNEPRRHQPGGHGDGGFELQSQHGLLTNDALNLAVIKRLGLQEIATADSNFDHVPGLIVYRPSDLP